MTNICIIATIIIYLVAMLLVGFAYSKSNNDSTDFYLGGSKMGPLVTAMLPRPAQSAQRTGRGDHHRVLCALHGFGLCRLR